MSLSTRLMVNVLFGGIGVNSDDGKIIEGINSNFELERSNNPLIERTLSCNVFVSMSVPVMLFLSQSGSRSELFEVAKIKLTCDE
jgi:hypothetical protein